MPGANYMGGKRNAAKARTRDVVGRQQKGFFGRQRLNILSKALQTSTPKLSRDASDPRAKEEITLAHAHSKHIPEPQSPLHKSPSTPPPWKKQRVLMEAHTSSSGASGSSRRQSKVLDALDIEEPMFLRGVLDRILAMPDLAGLPSVREAQRLMPKRLVPLAPRGKKRQRTPSPSGVQYSHGLYGNRSSSSVTSIVDEALTHEQTDMGERAHIFTESVHSTSSKGKYQSSKHESVQPEFEESQQEEESDFNDSGYAEHESKENDHESIWPRSSSPRFSDSPPKESSQEGRALQVSSSPRSRRAETEALVHYSSSTSEAPMSDDVGLGDSWLPSMISLKPRRAGSWPAYGCLFEQEDPWCTIGLILGLPESTPTVEEMGFAMNVYEDRDVVLEMLDGVTNGFEIEEFGDSGEELPNEAFDSGSRSAEELNTEGIKADELQEEAFDGVMSPTEEVDAEDAQEGESSWNLNCSDWSQAPEAALDGCQDQGEFNVDEVEMESRQENSLFSSPFLNAKYPSSHDNGVAPSTSEEEFRCEMLGSPGIPRLQTQLDARQMGSQNKSLIAMAELQELDGKFLGPNLFGKEVDDDTDRDEARFES